MKANSHPFMVSLHSLETKIDELKREFRIREITDSGYVLLDNADFIQLFKISAKTAQHWREEGLIEYSQIKGKIYYKLQDVKAFIDRNRQSRK
ncbi:MAG: helix-turn-helix domain-containing protein [Salegentibacter sp.]